jgi:mycothiol synthase
MSQKDDIDRFLEMLASYDGHAPFSDAKLPIDPNSGKIVVIAEDAAVTAIGATGVHHQSDGSIHRALETAVRPEMRFAAFEGAVLDASLPLIGAADSSSVWSQRSTLDTALTERGYVENRSLDFMVVELPLEPGLGAAADSRIRTFVAEDLDEMLAVNAAAFVGHREAASLDALQMARYRSEPWFDPKGILIAQDGGVVGFCWTRVHPNGDGEIYRIAVEPAHHGTGLGMSLLLAGFRHLAGLESVRRGVLWVDGANTAAVRLYHSVGMETERTNREFIAG